MANPGYPQMGQMPPGMGPPMGGPPMGMPPGMPPRPVRQGVSKAVPIVVSAGLAVGVFCGLLFGVGTGKKDAVAAPSKGTNAKEQPVEDTTHLVETPTKPLTPTAQIGAGSGSAAGSGAGSGSAVAAAAGSAAGSGAGSGSAAVAMKTLTIKVEPDAAASVAKIQIDGKAITGTSIELPEATTSVKVSLSAAGYHSIDKTIELLGEETTVEFPMQKRGGASPGFGGADTHRPTVPKRPPGPKKQPGGLIDI